MLYIILFAVIFLCIWIMDSVRFRHRQSPFRRWEWFRPGNNFEYIDRDPAKGRKKFLGITLPRAMFDAWHFFKMIMVGCIILLISILLSDTVGELIRWFITLSIAYNLIWYLMYDRFYGVKP